MCVFRHKLKIGLLWVTRFAQHLYFWTISFEQRNQNKLKIDMDTQTANTKKRRATSFRLVGDRTGMYCRMLSSAGIVISYFLLYLLTH